MKLVTQRCANNMSGWSSVQSTNMADSVEESTIPEKEVTEDAEVALEKKLSEVNCGSLCSSMPLEHNKLH